MHTLARHADARAVPLPAANWRTPVVAIQSGGSKRPLFYMHVHWQGGAFYCFNLAQMLGPDQPFHILDLYRFDDLPAPPTIETMAADYIAPMRRIQPEGTYQVAAFCGASIIAYEMAQQLRRAGQEVDLLAFIDPMAGPIQSIRCTSGSGPAPRPPLPARPSPPPQLRAVSPPPLPGVLGGPRRV